MEDKVRRIDMDHFTGAANEYLAASMFLKQGFQVYWPAMYQDAVDFAICKDGVFQRVQVKTATWNNAGKFRYLQCRTKLTKKYTKIKPSELYELLVAIAPDKRIWVIPASIITSSNISLDGNGPNNKRRNNWFRFQV